MADIKTRYSVIEDLSGKIATELRWQKEALDSIDNQVFLLEKRKRADERYYEDMESEIAAARKTYEEQLKISERNIEQLRESIKSIESRGGGAQEKE